MEEYSVIGKRIPRIDGRVKVSGEAKYAADYEMPGMLWCKMLRSPHPHAMICRLDVSKAQALKGVMAVITASDVPGDQDKNEMVSPELPHLARNKVAYAGQPVAAGAAINPIIAEEALNLIEVEYEELTPLFDVLETMKPEALLICPDMVTHGPLEKKKARFIEVVETEVMNLHEGNIARYRIRPSEYQTWKKTWR